MSKTKKKKKTPAILALFPHTACTSGAGAHSGCLLFLRRLWKTGWGIKAGGSAHGQTVGCGYF